MEHPACIRDSCIFTHSTTSSLLYSTSSLKQSFPQKLYKYPKPLPNSSHKKSILKPPCFALLVSTLPSSLSYQFKNFKNISYQCSLLLPVPCNSSTPPQNSPILFSLKVCSYSGCNQ